MSEEWRLSCPRLGGQVYETCWQRAGADRRKGVQIHGLLLLRTKGPRRAKTSVSTNRMRLESSQPLFTGKERGVQATRGTVDGFQDGGGGPRRRDVRCDL